MSLADLNALYQAAVAALSAGDYALAIEKALACQALLAITPNVTRNLAGGGSQGLAFAGTPALEQFIARVQRLQNAQAASRRGGPYQTTKIRYQRAGTEEC